MAFIKFSSDFNASTHTLVDNIFIGEYLPTIHPLHLKIYLYGLYLCSRQDSRENSAEDMAKALGLEFFDIENSFRFLQENGLVRITCNNPLEIAYLPVMSGMAYLKKIKPGKYDSFCAGLQDLIKNRQITPNEFNEYFNVMEVSGILPDAMLMIAGYCIQHKKDSYSYILTVARNWAADGVKTKDDVLDKLEEYNLDDRGLTQVLKALKSKKQIDSFDRDAYHKWTRELGFDLPAILFAAKSIKGRGGVERLDGLLMKFYETRNLTAAEMDAFINHKETLYGIAREVTKRLGVYYERLDYFVESYILDWFNKGYDGDTLGIISDYCFKHSIKRPEKMRELVEKLSEKGLKESAAVKAYLEKLDAPPLAAERKAKNVPYQDKQYTAEEITSLFANLDEEIK
jgi:DnaD/phage-associated family protein